MRFAAVNVRELITEDQHQMAHIPFATNCSWMNCSLFYLIGLRELINKSPTLFHTDKLEFIS